jgi:general secretion pathway protein J
MIRRYEKPASGIQRGFTLVEVLLAMTLMSMLLALAYGGLRASTRATEKGQQILDDSNRIRMAHQFVRKQLTQLLPLAFDEDETQQLRTVFEGSSRRIRYVAQMPGYLGFGGPQVQELEFVQGEEGLELVLSHALLQGFEEEYLYEREPVLLLDKVQTAEFSFLGIDENGEMTQWTPDWEDETVLPSAVALDVRFVDDVFIQWPVLTTSVRIDQGAVGGANNRSVNQSYSTTIRELMQKRKNPQ